MKRCRVLIDLSEGRIVPSEVDVVELADGELVYRHYDRSLRPLDAEPAFTGDRYISSGWHENLAAARAEAIAGVEQRVAKLKQLVDEGGA